MAVPPAYYEAMRGLSIWIHGGLSACLALACAGSASSQTAEPRARLAGAIIMFGANWCAPCLEELRNLPELAAATAPGRLILAWRDGSPKPFWPAWPANADIKPSAEIERIVGSKDLSAGLPYAVVLDGKGERCAVLNGKLTKDRIARLRARCSIDD